MEDQSLSHRSPRQAPELAVQHKASDYRLMAALCLDVANKMPSDSDRALITDMAQKWLELAQKREAEQLSEASQQALL